MDLMSFRELYGYMTADQKDELAKLKAASGVTEVTRENAEAALFGEDSVTLVAEATPGAIDEDAQLDERRPVAAPAGAGPRKSTPRRRSTRAWCSMPR